jgi:peptidoglycan-associated lipoprotein
MKRLKSTFNSILLVLLITVSASAQKSFIRAGDKAFNSMEYYNAIDIYKKALSQNPKKDQKARLIFQVAQCYRLTGDMKHAEEEYAKAIKADYDDAIAILYLADAQMMLGKYDDALASFQQYSQKVPSDPRGANGVKSCQLAQQLLNAPTRYVVTNMAQLNTKFEDFAPSYSDRRMDEIVFTSTRQGTMGDKVDDGLGQNFSDIFITKLDKNGKFSAPLPLPAPINTPDNEGSPSFDKVFKTMYFTRCSVTKNKGVKCKIYSTQRRGNNWTDPIMLNFQIDTVTYGHPAISADDQTILFSSDMQGGQGGFDIWMSKYDKKTKTWGAPENLGPGINTPGDEMYPYIHADGSLYFASSGLPGLGGLDIFHAAKTGDNKWANPVNMGSPINSEGDDFGIIFEGTKDRGYFSSNRSGGRGSDDIYSFYMPPILFVINGTVYDVDTHKPIPGATVRMVGSDGSDVSQKTDTGGHYLFGALGANERYVKLNSSYILSANATDLRYLNSDERANETTVGKTESETFTHDFQLKKPGIEVRFPDVLYPLDKAFLTDQSKDSLNFLVRLLNNNPTLKIELDAHTDQQGSLGHNMKLSQARAQSCVSYLISQGIDSARLTPKGWGPTKLLIKTPQIMAVKNKNPKIQKHIRDSLYQINRRTVFHILSWDYVPKGHVMTKEDSLKMEAGKAAKVHGEEAPMDSTDAAPVPEEERQQQKPAAPANNKPAAPANNKPAAPAPSNPKNSATKPKNN